MNSNMLKHIKSNIPGKEYPSNLGKLWTNDEERLLFVELNENIDIEQIAQSHNRTVGGIRSRCHYIAYKMYLDNVSMEEIIEKTKLDKKSIQKIIDRKQSNNKKKAELKPQISMETEIAEIKNDIKELKNTIKDLVEMMKAVYEFEDA